MPAHDTQLADRRLLGMALEGAVDTSGIESAAKDLGRLILAGDTDQPCRCTECGDVQCHVARATGPVLDLVDADNRYRRLRGDAFTGTMPVAIQHDISDNQDRGAIKTEIGRASCRERAWSWGVGVVCHQRR